MASLFNKIYRGSLGAYERLTNIDDSAIYMIENETTGVKSMYKGSEKVAGDFIIAETEPEKKETGIIYYIGKFGTEQKPFLGYYDGDTEKWVSMFSGIEETIKDDEEIAATAIAQLDDKIERISGNLQRILIISIADYEVLSEKDPNTVYLITDDRTLCFKAVTANSSVQLTKNGTPTEVSLETSTDGNTWTTYTIGNAITLANVGDKVYMRNTSDTPTGFSTSTDNYYKFVMNGQVAAQGDITSLVDKEGSVNTIPCNYCFYKLFEGCSSLVKAPELPSTTLTEGCYRSMFDSCQFVTPPVLPGTNAPRSCYNTMFAGCSAMTSAPELPVTVISPYCYYAMFRDCTSITTAPSLPAPILEQGCYGEMFNGCTSLTTAPELMAETTVGECYAVMFKNCSNLSRIKMMATTLSGSNNFGSWVDGVSATGTFIKSSLTTLPTGTSGIPSGWTIVNYYGPLCFTAEQANSSVQLTKNGTPTEVSLQISTDGKTWSSYTIGNTITLANAGDKVYMRNTSDTPTGLSTSTSNCYKFVMTGKIAASGSVDSLRCKDETRVTSETDYCYNSMFSNCTSLTQAPELPVTTLADSCYSAMFNGCTSLTQAPELPATTLTPACYGNMFQDCTSLTQAPELPATTLDSFCYGYMFGGCTSLTQAPELPATTLAYYCYQFMFYGCTNLNYVKCFATDISARNCLYNWLDSVSTTGTFVKKSGVTWSTGVDGIPSGWTVQEV